MTNKFNCPYCKKEYKNIQDAYVCYQSHDIVYLMITRADLQTLIRFIYSGDRSLLTDSLVETILSYSRYNRKDTD